MSATARPASWRDVMAAISTSGCSTSKRSNSTPVYPVPPTIPTLIMVLRHSIRLREGAMILHRPARPPQPQRPTWTKSRYHSLLSAPRLPMPAEWIEALHIISVVCWFAALFYLPRLFVYHAMAEDRISIERFKIMERKLSRGIATPAMIAALTFGIWLASLAQDYYLHQG